MKGKDKTYYSLWNFSINFSENEIECKKKIQSRLVNLFFFVLGNVSFKTTQ